MNLDLTDSQEMLRDTAARFFDDASSMTRVRAALPGGFDRAMWTGLAELGVLGVRIPEAAGGLDLGIFDAVVLMEEAGRALVSGPLAEAIVAARVLGQLAGNADRPLLDRIMAGDTVVVLAFHDVAANPRQWVAGAGIADWVIAIDGDDVILATVPTGASEPTLASTPLAEIDLASAERRTLATGRRACDTVRAAIEEWKLLLAAALTGLSDRALALAADYATERSQFGRPIGTYQAISHPLADLKTSVIAGRYHLWHTVRAIADGAPDAGAAISQAAWWAAHVASRAVSQSLHTFGGYGLSTEYDIHLFNLRAKEWPLAYGDPAALLFEAGRRLYAGEITVLPDAGEVPIDFDPGDDARALAAETDAFFRATLTPELKAKAHYSFDGHDAGVHRALASAGLLFPAWPVADGGRGAAPYAVGAARDVWDQHGWTSHVVVVASMVGQIIARFGSDELKAEVLTRIATGDAICSLGFSEPGSGSDVFAAQTRATPDGNGWRIDGQKMFTSGANIADYVLLLTRTDASVAKHRGLTMFIVPLKAEGVTIQPVHTFQDERTNITFYDGVKVPDTYRLGDIGDGVRVMAASLELEHSGGFGKVIGYAVQAAATLCRDAIGIAGTPLIASPDAQARLARGALMAALSEVLASRAAWARVERRDAPASGPMAKLFSSDQFVAVSSDLLDLTAPLSLSKRDGLAGFLNQCYRHAQGTTIYGGTSEIHRSMVAERALGLPRTRV